MRLLLFVTCIVLSIWLTSAQLLRKDKMKWAGAKHKKHHGKKHMLGGDDHDLKSHKRRFLGKDDHDKRPHLNAVNHRDEDGSFLQHLDSPPMDDAMSQRMLDGGNQDRKHHNKKPHHMFGGGDDHDMRPHHKMPHRMLGRDGHDMMSHGKQPHHILGGDDHDMIPHGKPPHHWLGGDDHDMIPHGKPPHHMLGGDDHDMIPHGKPPHHMLGGDDHDMRPHGVHMMMPHERLRQHGYGMMMNHRMAGNDEAAAIKFEKKNKFGGDDHDYKPHHHSKKKGGKKYPKKTYGGIHEQKKQKKREQKKRRKQLLGGGNHDIGHMGMFKTFTNQFNKTYESEIELKKRFGIFRANMRKASVLQSSEQGTAKYGPTMFADLTEVEFKKHYLGLRPDLKPAQNDFHKPAEDIPEGDIPKQFDWRDKGVVTPVKNQGMCGSCWAFSVTGNVEGQYALKHKHLFSLSEQELVDCDSDDSGCEGGLPENAYKAINKLGGLETEHDYPYDAKDDQCQFQKQKVKVQVNGSVEIPKDEVAMAKWLVKKGPISIGINANALQFYMGGVSHPLKFLCNPESLDHGMLIVGYGVHVTKYLHRVQPYWIVKNSWGPSWGEQGYYRVYRGDDTCGVNQMATSGIVV